MGAERRGEDGVGFGVGGGVDEIGRSDNGGSDGGRTGRAGRRIDGDEVNDSKGEFGVQSSVG